MSTNNSKTPLEAQPQTYLTLPENKNFTYKELCSKLGLPIKTNEARASQLTKLEEFFTLKKVGNSFRVLSNKKPFPVGSVLPRKPSEGIWLKDLSAQILHDLSVNYLEEQSSPSFQDYKEIGLSITSALLQYGFCNEKLKLPLDELLSELNFQPDNPYPIRILKANSPARSFKDIAQSSILSTQTEVKKFSNLSEEAFLELIISKIRSKGNEVLRSSLDHLKKRLFLNYRYSYSFLKEGYLHLASPEEDKFIEVISLKALQLPSIKCKTIEEAIFSGKKNQFFHERNSRLLEHGISAPKRTYILNFTPEQLSLAQTYRKELELLLKHKKALNQTSQAYFSAFFLKETSNSQQILAQKSLNFVLPL